MPGQESKNRNNVVPFTRTADYMHQRAQANRRENKPLDALALLRRAVEREPGNLQYRMDLAETLCEMGCHAESNEELTRILMLDAPLGECMFGMSCNYFALNDLNSAQRLLAAFVEEDPEAVKREEVTQHLRNLALANGMLPDWSRAARRAQRLAQIACLATRRGDLAQAERMFRKALAFQPEQGEYRALFGLCLYIDEKPEEACREATRACAAAHASVKTLCVAARVFEQCGRGEECLKLLKRAEESCEDGEDMLTLVGTVCEMGLNERALPLCRRALREIPYERHVLHCYAAAQINTGLSQKHAALCWARILRVDPEDTVAQYYFEQAVAGNLRAPVTYRYCVPGEERLRRAEYLEDAVGQGAARMNEMWEEAPQLAQTIRWALNGEDVRFVRVAINILFIVDRPGAELMLRQYLLKREAPEWAKKQAVARLALKGAKGPYICETGDGVALVQRREGMKGGLSPRAQRVARLAARYAALLEREWTNEARARCVERLSKLEGAIGDVRAMAGALLFREFRDDMEPKEIAQVCGCTARALLRCALRVAGE